jgi:hypothetical protein
MNGPNNMYMMNMGMNMNNNMNNSKYKKINLLRHV